MFLGVYRTTIPTSSGCNFSLRWNKKVKVEPKKLSWSAVFWGVQVVVFFFCTKTKGRFSTWHLSKYQRTNRTIAPHAFATPDGGSLSLH